MPGKCRQRSLYSPVHPIPIRPCNMACYRMGSLAYELSGGNVGTPVLRTISHPEKNYLFKLVYSRLRDRRPIINFPVVTISGVFLIESSRLTTKRAQMMRKSNQILSN